MPTTKPIYQSWTLWFNVLAAVYAVLEQAGIFTALPAPWQAVILIVGNLLLRFKTTTGVSLT